MPEFNICEQILQPSTFKHDPFFDDATHYTVRESEDQRKDCAILLKVYIKKTDLYNFVPFKMSPKMSRYMVHFPLSSLIPQERSKSFPKRSTQPLFFPSLQS